MILEKEIYLQLYQITILMENVNYNSKLLVSDLTVAFNSVGKREAGVAR